MELVGRHKEIKDLNTLYKSRKPEFAAMIGRRRVGKTFLIRKAYEGKISFELTGLQHATKEEQLTNFFLTYNRYFTDTPLTKKPKSWMEAFNALSLALQKLGKGRKVVFLDEVPWLGSRKSGFINGLSYFWNSHASKDEHNILLIVCGSTASWIIDKIFNDRGGLHNRVTKRFHILPFTLAETEEFCKMKMINMSRAMILQIYMVMGGIPMYLEQLSPGKSAIQNIDAIYFDKSGYLRNEFDRLFASLFENYSNHVELVRTLAKKRKGMTREEIISNSTFKNGGMLTKLLEELDQSDFIQIQDSYEKRAKGRLYRLTDPFTLFYLTFIDKLGANTKQEMTKLQDLPSWKSWSGYAYENTCMQHINQIRKALGISGMTTFVSSFFAKPKDHLPGARIDLLIDRNDQAISICEIKYSHESYILTKAEIEKIELRKKVFRYHSKTKKHLFSTLITTVPPVQNDHLSYNIDSIVVMDDLFEKTQ